MRGCHPRCDRGEVDIIGPSEGLVASSILAGRTSLAPFLAAGKLCSNVSWGCPQLQMTSPGLTTIASASSRHADEPRLRGDLAIWFIIALEMLTFGVMFVSYAFARSVDLALFNASQATLDLRAGALNTVLLLTGSWCVARAVHALRADASRNGARWLAAAIACGLGFMVSKGAELGQKFAAGIDMSTNTFYMFYVMLTAFHFMHVAAAVVLLVIVWTQARRGAYADGNMHTPETVAAFWHMVDLLWIVLFPLVYVLR